MTLDDVDGSPCDREGSKKTAVLIELVCPRSAASDVGVGVISVWRRVVWSPDAVSWAGTLAAIYRISDMTYDVAIIAGPLDVEYCVCMSTPPETLLLAMRSQTLVDVEYTHPTFLACYCDQAA